MPQPASLHLGTAGWSVPAAYAERVGGPGAHLERYARVMTAVEINSSFYRPHRRVTYERWAASTPAGFRFSVKTPRLLTHDQHLAEPEAGLDRFAAEVVGLGPKLGALLVQLPPSLALDAARAERFFAALAARIETPIVCEPRHASWFTAEAEAWLAGLRIARVAADPAPVPSAARPGGWPGLLYIRLHGSPRMYYSAYGDERLDRLAAALAARRQPAWCIFDNTAHGHALGDALKLSERLPPDPVAEAAPRPECGRAKTGGIDLTDPAPIGRAVP